MQENKAQAVVAGANAAPVPRFEKNTSSGHDLDEASLARARRLVGLRGYATTCLSTIATAEGIASYHDPRRVEQSFRMYKTDLGSARCSTTNATPSRPTAGSWFDAPVIARHLPQVTGVSIKKLITTPRPLREVTITAVGPTITAEPKIPARRAVAAGVSKGQHHFRRRRGSGWEPV